MKLMFASDLHGSAYYARKVAELYQKEKAEKLILLGDLLYHGPRNDLPRDYAPKEVIALLNGLKNEILAVSGNCEAEADQMVLEFPVMADYAALWLEAVSYTHLAVDKRQLQRAAGHRSLHGAQDRRCVLRRPHHPRCCQRNLSAEGH